MAKKDEVIPEPPAKTKEEIELETKKKTDDAEAAIKKAAGERVNIIGEIKDVKKPDPDDPKEVKEYFKKIDEKIEKLLSFHEPKKPDPTPTPDPEPKPKKVAWYDKELL